MLVYRSLENSVTIYGMESATSSAQKTIIKLNGFFIIQLVLDRCAR